MIQKTGNISGWAIFRMLLFAEFAPVHIGVPAVYTSYVDMESVKAYIIGWLDWGANYVKEDPEDFFSKCESLSSESL